MEFTLPFNKETSRCWSEEKRYNEMLLDCNLSYLNDMYKIDGIITLKDILKALGYNIRQFGMPELLIFWDTPEKKLPIKCKYVSGGNYELTFEVDLEVGKWVYQRSS